MTSWELSFIRANLGDKSRGSLTPEPKDFTVTHGLGYVLPNPGIKVRKKDEESMQGKNS